MIFFSIPTHVRKKTECKVIMSVQPSTIIVKLMALKSEVQALGMGQFSNIVKMY